MMGERGRKEEEDEQEETIWLFRERKKKEREREIKIFVELCKCGRERERKRTSLVGPSIRLPTLLSPVLFLLLPLPLSLFPCSLSTLLSPLSLPCSLRSLSLALFRDFFAFNAKSMRRLPQTRKWLFGITSPSTLTTVSCSSLHHFHQLSQTLTQRIHSFATLKKRIHLTFVHPHTHPFIHSNSSNGLFHLQNIILYSKGFLVYFIHNIILILPSQISSTGNTSSHSLPLNLHHCWKGGRVTSNGKCLMHQVECKPYSYPRWRKVEMKRDRERKWRDGDGESLPQPCKCQG